MPVKKIEGLSSIAEIQKKVTAETSTVQHPRKKWVRPTIVLLLGILILLGGYNFFSSRTFSTLAGYGSVSGNVVNLNKTPVPAEISVLTQNIMASADAQGQFQLSKIPAGKSTLIIAYQGMGKEIPLTIKAGEDISIGQIIVAETQLPPENKP
ncbi:MAG: carboxypeptidase-like regulatory domain-containing protein [Chloroflexi bacterium]|nr:carboxypeptidase-like regulatory domain-containing protein [Chloroflexota bacterium]